MRYTSNANFEVSVHVMAHIGMAGDDFPQGRSQRPCEGVFALTVKYSGVLEEVGLQQEINCSFEWTNITAELKRQAEMRVHTAIQDMYDTYGMSSDHGTLALVGLGALHRPLRLSTVLMESDGCCQRVPKVPWAIEAIIR